MGLAITYSLRLQSVTSDVILATMNTLHRHAADLPFVRLGEVVDLRGEDCLLNNDDTHTLLKFGAMTLEDYGEIHKNRFNTVPTCSQLIGFEVLPGDGCNTCTFGLASDADHPQNWHWYDYCKTQYASNPDYGGLANFLQSHLAVLKLLECCQQLDILEKATDPSGYWEHQDMDALVTSLREHNILTAAMIGSFKDLLEPLGYTTQAPILERPDFEHLEAQGRIPAPGEDDSSPS
jgi:hypothetical protein